MPEPDFGQMARSTTGFLRDDPERLQALELNIIDLLQQVWNARGAADVTQLTDPVTNAVDEWVRAGAGSYEDLQLLVAVTMSRALRSVDR